MNFHDHVAETFQLRDTAITNQLVAVEVGMRNKIPQKCY